MFSSAGNTINKTRSSLEANSVYMPLCLGCWLSVDI